ncbi:MAG TPA: DUF4190 domain-containing protein [Ilumatobacteraceae bacterium]|nr:DUF4190 domain-containing protein [Ilumatobacteraceae bacterium]
MTNEAGAAAGWYVDPMGRYEHRYYNGRAWTSDVAADGQRFVDPLGLTPSPTPSDTRSNPGIATAAMVLGIVGVTLAWVPFLVALGLVAAVLAIALGIAGLRSARRSGANRGHAVVGLATGGGALVISVVGIALTVVVLDAYDDYLNPPPNEVETLECTLQGSRATMVGELTNLGDDTADFTVLVGFVRPGSDDPDRRARVAVDEVAPGESAQFDAQAQVDLDEVECVVIEVSGPLPFGVTVD